MEPQIQFLALFNYNFTFTKKASSKLFFSSTNCSVSHSILKRFHSLVIVFLAFFSVSISTFGQTTYHWRALAGSGNWTNPANWSTAGRLGGPAASSPGNLNTDIAIFDEISGLVVAVDQDLNIGKLNFINNSNITLQPSGGSRNFLIRTNEADAISISSNSSLDLSGNAGGDNLTLSFSGAVVTGQSIGGYLKVSKNGGSGTFDRNNAPITFGASSTYEHARDGGVIPQAVWDPSSTLYVTGIESSGFTSFMSDQSFGNLTWDCPLQDDLQVFIGAVSNVTITIKGDMNIVNSGYEFLMLIDANRPANLQVEGDMIVGDGVNDARIYLNGGTQNTVINIGGDLIVNLNGRFELQNGTSTVNMGIAGSAMNSIWGGTGSYANDDISYVIRNQPAGKTVRLSNFASNILLLAHGSSVTVSSGATLNCGIQTIGGTGGFTMEAGGILGLGHPNGLDGNVTASGPINFNSTGAATTFVYNGSTSNQITGTSLPATVTNLRIQNTFPNSIVNLSNSTTVNGILTLNTGVLSIGANNIILASGAALAGNAPGINNMVATETGKFFKYFQAGDSPAFTFPIGELIGRDYTPVVLDFSGNTSPGLVGFGVIDANHPNIANGGSPTGYLSRYWPAETSGLTDYTYNVSAYTYMGADIVGSEVEMKLSYWNGSIWTPADNSAAGMNTLAISSPLNNATGILDGNAFTGRSRVCIGDIEVPTITCPPDLSENVAAGSCSATVIVPDAVLFDNCAVPNLTFELTGATVGAGSGQMGNYLFNSGVTNVKLTATDGSGNTTFCTFTVTVNDIIIPSIICPANLNVLSNPVSCGAVVAYAPPVGTDNCPGALTVQIAGLASGSFFPQGITTNTFRVTDAAGNTATCSFTVTVTDNVVPVVLCRDITIYLDGTGNAILTGNDINNGSSDNCPGLTFFVSRTNFSCADLGAPVPVTLTGTDATGNSATCSSFVTVLDTVRPIVNVKTFDLVLGADGSGTLLPSDVDNGSFDNCTLVALSVAPNNFSCGDQGQQTVVLTAVDSHGNSRSKPVEITISSSLQITSASLSNCDIAAPFALYSSSVIGGNGTYSYFWDGLEDNADPFVNFDLIFPFLHFTNTSASKTPLFNNLMPDGNYNIRLVVTDGNGCVDTSEFLLNKGGIVYNNISVTYSDACEGGTETYSVTSYPTATYSWNVINGTILGPSDESSVQVLWNMGVLEGVVIGNTTKPDLLGNPCGSSVVDSVSVHPTPVPQFLNPVIEVCSNSQVTYTLTDTYATYNWTILGGVITNGGTINDNYATVLWGAGAAGRVTVSAGTIVTCTGSVFVDVSIFSLAGTIASTNVTCNNASDGTVTAVANAGSGHPPYEYSLDGGVYGPSGSFTGIDPGNHFVRIRDMLLCTIDLPFTITQPLILQGNVASQTDASCFGGSNGAVTISASGGLAPYQYSIDGGAYQGSNTFNGLSAGPHTIIIIDAGSCTRNVNFNISQPLALTGIISLQTNVDCFGNSTGSVSVGGSGGVSPYTYSLDGGLFQGNGNFNGLAAGSYSVTVRDANLCSFNVAVVIDQPGILTGAIASLTNATCSGEATGQVTMASGGGTSPYQYSINAGPYQASPTIMGLAAGSYIVTIRDARMCTVDVPVNITEPAVLVAMASSNSPVCQGTPLNIFGGPAGMSVYSWTGPNGYISASQNPNISLNATPALNGVYNLTVTSPDGCIASTNVNATVTPVNTVNLTSLPATENQTVCINMPITGITYSTTGATGANVTDLPSGVTGSWAAGVVTISGAPAVSGTFSYTVILTGGCGIAAKTGTISVNSSNIISLTSLPATENQTVCMGTPVSTITYSTTGATGADVTGLPAGVTGSWAGNIVTISGVPAASGIFGYTVTLTGGCGIVMESGTINVNPDNTISLTSLPATENQSVCINAPVSNITYSTTGATGANVTGLPAGVMGTWAGNVVTISGTPAISGSHSYSITLTGGCGIVTGSGTITVNPDNTIILTSLPATENQSVCINSPVADITYSTSGATGASVTGLPAGVSYIWAADVLIITGTPSVSGVFGYTVNLTGGCGTVIENGTLTVIPNNSMALTSLPATENQETCINSQISDITYSATGATGANVTGLPAGVTGTWSGNTVTISGTPVESGAFGYTVSLTGGCGIVTTAGSINVNVLPQVLITNPVPSCSPANLTAGTVTAGSTPGLTFTYWTDAPATLPYATPSMAPEGTYDIKGTNPATGCYDIKAVTVSIVFTSVIVITNPPPACSPSTVDLTSAGVTAGSSAGLVFTYWTNASATIPYATPAAATDGTYYIQGTDPGTGCFDIKPVIATVNELPAVTFVQTNVLCFGAATGAIDITVTGGAAPYAYSWTGTGVAAGSEDQTGLIAGAYEVTVTDANNCQPVMLSVTITQTATAVSGIIVGQTDVTLFGGNDGSVEVAGSGGIAPYLYRIGTGAYNASGVFTSLAAGSYNITVKDANLCTFDIPVTIIQPLSGNVAVIDVACFGGSTGTVDVTGLGGVIPYVYQVDGGAWQASGTFGSLAAGNYLATVRDANMDTFDIPFTVFSPSEAVGGTIITQSDVLCFGGNTGLVTVAGSGGIGPYLYSIDGGSFQASGSFSLQAGTHLATVMDSKQCQFNISVIIDEPASALAGSITSQTNITCHGSANGSVAASASGGTAPFEYSLNGGAFQSSGAFNGLPAGSNTIAVRDANLCTIILPVSIAEPAELVLSAEVTDVGCPGTNQGIIILTITGGTLPYEVLWSDGIATVSRINITDGDYTVEVTDGNGCIAKLEVTVGVTGSEDCIEVPVIITPNGDGSNDTWRIKNIDMFPNAEVVIFNRWGQRVFSTKNILANPWDGTLKGKPLPVDSYHYILDFHNGSKPRSGVISIIK